MHIVAAAPRYLSRDEVDAAVLDRERDLLTEQAAASGKPAATIEKMVAGRLGKFYKEVVLLEQEYIVEDKAGDVRKVPRRRRRTSARGEPRGLRALPRRRGGGSRV